MSEQRDGGALLEDNILRVAPDILPAGSVRLEAVWISEADPVAAPATAPTAA